MKLFELKLYGQVFVDVTSYCFNFDVLKLYRVVFLRILPKFVGDLNRYIVSKLSAG